MKKISLIGWSMPVLLLTVQTVVGEGGWVARIPNGSAFSCATCHTPSFDINPFGSAFNNAGRSWTANLAGQDSDGDGASNGRELGDAIGAWIQGQPNPPGPVFNPGDATSTPPANVAPTVGLTAPANGATFTAPANITITATATDSDGTVAQVQFLSGTTVLGTDTSAPFSFAWNNVAAGTYTLTARATDNNGASTTSTAVTITVSPPANVAPTVTLTAPANGATFIAPAGITIAANAADSDGTVAQVQFLSGTTVLGTDTSAPFSFAWNNVAAGTYTLTARATDDDGAVTTSSEVMITVNPPPNAAPTVSLTAPTNGAAFIAPASIMVTANAADSDGTVAQVQFLSGTTVLGTDTSAPYSFVWDVALIGSFTITAIATDDDGATTTSSAVTITVNPPANVAPTVTLTAPANGATFTAPASITITANATDSDGTVAQVQFLSGSTVLGTDTSAPFSFAWNNVAAGTYTLTARATDDDGASTTSSAITITVNQAATAPAIVTQPQGQSVSVGDDVTFSVVATGTSPLSYQWFKNNAAINGAAGSSLNLSDVAVADAGSYHVVVTNLAGAVTSAVAMLTVSQPPLAIILTSPEDGATYIAPASISLAASVTPAGNIAQVEFLLNSVVIGSVATAPFALTTNIAVLGDYTLAARVTDLNGNTATSSPVNIRVVESAPISVTLTSPEDGTSFLAPAKIKLVAELGNVDGVVTNVEFYAGNTLIGVGTPSRSDDEDECKDEDDEDEHDGEREDDDDREHDGDEDGEDEGEEDGEDDDHNPTRFTFTWMNVSAGNYTLTARATDNLGRVGTSDSIQINVTEPLPVVSLITTDSSASINDGRTNTATLQIRRNRGTNTTLVVNYAVSGTASNGVDYVVLPGSVTIPPGQRSADITVSPLPGAARKLTLILTLHSADTYLVGKPNRAKVTITRKVPKVEEMDDRSRVIEPGLVKMVIQVPNAGDYAIEVSDDLQHWESLFTIQAKDGTVSFLDPDSNTSKRRFYRATTMPDQATP